MRKILATLIALLLLLSFGCEAQGMKIKTIGYSPTHSVIFSEYTLVPYGNLNDDFSAGSLNSNKWTVTNKLAGGGSGTTTQTGGVLDLALSGLTDGNNHILVHTSQNYAVRGDFDVQVDFTLVTYPSAQKWFVYLDFVDTQDIITDSIKPEQEIRVDIAFDSSNHRRYGGEIRVDGTPSLLEGTGTYSATTTDTSGKLRVTRSGTTGTTYYWNGTGWTTLESGTMRTDDMWVILWLSSTGGAPDCEVQFDNLTMNSGTLLDYAPY